MFSNQSRKQPCGDWEASRSRLGMGKELAPGEGQKVAVAVSGVKQRTSQAVRALCGGSSSSQSLLMFWRFSLYFFLTSIISLCDVRS